MNPPKPEAIQGFAHRHDNWHDVTVISTIGRRTMSSIPNYRLLKAATQVDASAASRLLLVHLIGYLGVDDAGKPESRFVVFPGNTRLSDELRCSVRSIQRQADELEALGMLRRCYNGNNRRTGFDLTPFAMQHEAVRSDIVAVQTKRKQEREMAQLELGLEADRVMRPMTSTSSQGDTNVVHNRKENIKNDGSALAAAALDAIDTIAFATVCEHISGSEDRTGEVHDAILASINFRFTGSGRTSHLGWVSALNALGRSRAVALYLVAESDPRRRASAERYFGWLLRTCAEGDSTIVCGATARATKAILAKSSTALAFPIPTIAAPASSTAAPATSPCSAGGLSQAIRHKIGERLYDTWLSDATITADGRDLIIKGVSQFSASWIKSHLTDAIETAAATHSGRAMALRVTDAR